MDNISGNANYTEMTDQAVARKKTTSCEETTTTPKYNKKEFTKVFKS